MVELDEKSRSETTERKEKNKNTFESVNELYEFSELILNGFRIRIYTGKETQEKGLKILTANQFFQRLPIVLARKSS